MTHWWWSEGVVSLLAAMLAALEVEHARSLEDERRLRDELDRFSRDLALYRDGTYRGERESKESKESREGGPIVIVTNVPSRGRRVG